MGIYFCPLIVLKGNYVITFFQGNTSAELYYRSTKKLLSLLCFLPIQQQELFKTIILNLKALEGLFFYAHPVELNGAICC